MPRPPRFVGCGALNRPIILFPSIYWGNLSVLRTQMWLMIQFPIKLLKGQFPSQRACCWLPFNPHPPPTWEVGTVIDALLAHCGSHPHHCAPHIPLMWFYGQFLETILCFWRWNCNTMFFYIQYWWGCSTALLWEVLHVYHRVGASLAGQVLAGPFFRQFNYRHTRTTSKVLLTPL